MSNCASPIPSPAIQPRSLADRTNNAPIKLHSDVTVGFIGAGQMAQAFIKGLLRASSISAEQIWVSNRSEHKLSKLTLRGVHLTTENIQVCKACNVIVLAVKPAVLPAVCAQISNHITNQHLVISIAAGVPISTIEAILPTYARVVRVMPNTPALVGEMAAGYSLGRHANADDGSLVESLLSPLGKAMTVDEKWLDAVSGLAGSGPAYVFMMIEALADGGVRSGLSRDVAQTLAAQTVYGAAKMVLDTGKHPAQLKDQVASPGGTTIAGIHALETGNFRGTVMNAVLAASTRAAELAQAATHVAATTTNHLAVAGVIPSSASASMAFQAVAQQARSRPGSPNVAPRQIGLGVNRTTSFSVNENSLVGVDSRGRGDRVWETELDAPARPA